MPSTATLSRNHFGGGEGPHVRELESYFLKRAGFGVEFALDGVQALQMTRDIRPDIVITRNPLSRERAETSPWKARWKGSRFTLSLPLARTQADS